MNRAFPTLLFPHRLKGSRRIVQMASALLILGMSAATVMAQSTNRDAPTPVTSDTLTGTGLHLQAQTFYYSLTAGPGELMLTLDADAGNTNGNGVVASYSLQNRDGGEILSADAYATPGMPARSVKRVSFRTASPMILVIRLAPGATADYTYTLKLSGAVRLPSPEPTPTPSPIR